MSKCQGYVRVRKNVTKYGKSPEIIHGIQSNGKILRLSSLGGIHKGGAAGPPFVSFGRGFTKGEEIEILSLCSASLVLSCPNTRKYIRHSEHREYENPQTFDLHKNDMDIDI